VSFYAWWKVVCIGALKGLILGLMCSWTGGGLLIGVSRDIEFEFAAT